MDWKPIGKDKIIKNGIYLFLAMLALAFLWGVTFLRREKTADRTEYPIVVMGDSIIGQCRDETSVTEQLSLMVGQPVFNGAFGGTRMTMCRQGTVGNYTMELLNMVSLSKAIAADDFGMQQTVRSRRSATEYFRDAVDELACVDFSKTRTLILEFGINDYHAAVPFDNPNDPRDAVTYAGAIRDVVTTLQKAYPKMRIVLVTPTYAWYLNDSLTCEEFDTGNGFLEEYVNVQLQVAEELGVETVDLYHNAYPHDNYDDWMIYTEDGVHPNEEGRKRIAGLLAEALQKQL